MRNETPSLIAKRLIQPSLSPRKTARNFRLTPGKVETAQKILGAPTATDAIETALDMVIFRDELVRGTKAAFGIQFTKPRRRR